MSRRAASSTIDLILRRRGPIFFAPKSSSLSQIGDYFYSNSRNFSEQGNYFSFSPKLPALDLSDAYHLFDELVRVHPQPRVSQYNKLLTVAAKTKHYSFALYMFAELRLRGSRMTFITFGIAMHCYCFQERVGYGLGVLSIVLKRGYQPDIVTFSILLKGLFLGDRAADAVNMFEDLLDFGICQPNDRMIAVMIDGLCKAGEIYAAIDLIRMAGNNTELGGTGNLLNVHACNALLDGFCKQRMIKDAEGMLKYMKERGISPNVVTYNTLLNGYCLQGDLTRAQQVFDYLDSDLKPDIITYGALINGYCKHVRLVKAQLLFGEVPVKGLGHNRYTYNTMIHGFFSNNKFAHGWKLLKQMEFQGSSFDIITCNILLGGLCGSGDIGQALLLLHTIEQEGVLDTNLITYNVILRGLLKRNWLHETKLVLEVMHEKGFALTYTNSKMLSEQVRGVREETFLSN